MTTEQTAVLSPALRLPGHGRRLLAFVFDAFLPTCIIAGLMVTNSWPTLGAWPTVAIIVLVLGIAGATNGLITWMSGGATLGKAWAGLQVRHIDGKTIAPASSELPKVLARFTVGYFLIDALLLGSLYALRDPRRRPLHDYVLRYEVVALSNAPSKSKQRIQHFKNDLAAGQTLIREQWKTFGFIIAAYVGVVEAITEGVVWAADKLGLSAPSTQSAASAVPIAAPPAAVPATGIAVGVAAGGTTLAAAATFGLAASLTPAAVGYPDEITLGPAVQFAPSAYPMGIPSDIELRLERSRPLNEEELDELVVLNAGDRATATLTYKEGDLEGHTFTFDEVVVPVEFRIEDSSETGVVSWRNLFVSAVDDAGFIPEGMWVADIRHVENVTYAGYQVAATGDLSLSFTYEADGSGGVEAVGVVLGWEGSLDCVVVNDSPIENFDASASCEDKVGEMFWVWGANSVTWSGG